MAKSITAHHLLSLAGMVREHGRKAQLPQTGQGRAVRGNQLAEAEGEGDGLDDTAGPDGPALGAGLALGDGADWAA